VTAIAQSGDGAVFAPAEIYGFCLGGFKLYRCEIASFMAAIAKGLGGAFAAGTPVIRLARFDFYGIRSLLCDRRF
jgi:hypothetical protein